MNAEWKELLDSLVNKLDEFDIHSYRLNDGSHILAELHDEEYWEDVIFIDLPISLEIGRNGQLFLSKWIFQNTDYDNFEPVELQRHSIVAKSRASDALKIEYLKYNFFSNLREKLNNDEFATVIDQINNIDLDTPDTADTDQEPPLSPEEIYNRRIKYPYWN